VTGGAPIGGNNLTGGAPIGDKSHPTQAAVHIETFTDHQVLRTSRNSDIKLDSKMVIPDVCLSAVSRAEKEDSGTYIVHSVIGNRQASPREMWLNLSSESERPVIMTIAEIAAEKCRGDGSGDGDTERAKEGGSAQYRRPSFIPGYAKPFPRVTIV
jgi:hypothetical protein